MSHLLVLSKLSVQHIGPIDLAFDNGDCVALTGPSGSGKSLLLRAIADLIPHQGVICLNDQDQTSVAPTQWRKSIAYVAPMTVWWHDRVAEHFQQTNEEQLESLGFSKDVLNWQCSRLSSGERQRLGLLRALQNNPTVLLLDEPSANLDPENTSRMEAFVLQYLKKQPACAIWVTHEPGQIKRIANRQLQLQNKQLVEISR